MTKPIDLPEDLPGTLTLDQVKASIGAFGYNLAMIPKPMPEVKPPVGVARDGK